MGGPSCKECVDLLVDYLDGKLPEDQEKELDAHFTACPPCLDFVEQYRAASRLGARAIATEMPCAIADKLAAFLGKHCK